MSSTTFEAPKVYPVIHNEETDGVLSSVEQVLKAGADGVFLINHNRARDLLLSDYQEVVQRFPDTFVGLNFLDMQSAADVYEYLHLSRTVPDAVWVDWYDLSLRAMEYIADITPQEHKTGRRTLLFAGVAHKAGLKHTDHPEISAQMAKHTDEYVDYVTTTGAATGIAAPLDKLIAMRAELKYAKFAVASGVTPENVASYVPLVDAMLVASSIESRFGEIDADRLASFMSAFKSAVESEREARITTS